MQKDEGLSTKLWLEERDNQQQNNAAPTLPESYKFTLNKSQTTTVTAFLKKNKFTLEELIYSAWGLLLSHISSTDLSVFGSGHIKTRHKPPLLSATLKPINSKISESITIKQYLTDIKKQIKNKKSEPTEIEPRYLCMAEHDLSPKNSMQLDINRFSLLLIYNLKTPGKFNLIYHRGNFQKANIQRLANYFVNILTGFCNKPNGKIIDIDLMDDDEKSLILKKLSIPHYPFKTPPITKCSHELISDFSRQMPDKIAVSHHGDTMTFAELEAQSEKLAHYFIELGIKPQDRVAVLMERTPSHIAAMLAIFKIGAVFVSINPKYPNERIEFVIEDSGAEYILLNNTERLQEKAGKKIIILSQNWRELPAASAPQQIQPADMQHIAYIIYTSGTTGKPKGVMIKYASLSNLAAWYRSCFHIVPDDRASQFASQGFDTFLCETMPILSLGASVHIVDDNIKLTPTLFFDWLRNEKITICDLPTAYAQMLFTMQWPNDLFVKMMKIGGETCTRYPSKAYPFDIWNIYGPTETTIEATYFKMHTANHDPSLTNFKGAPSIGKIMANGEAYVVDKYLRPVPVGVAGELLIGGVCVSPGYQNRDDLTKEKFIHNIFNPDSSSKLYRTGDLVCWQKDGNLEFIGRRDNQVKIRGYRIELGAIENVISQYPDVRDVAVIAKEMPNGEKSIIAYVAPNLDRERFLFQERCLISIDDNSFIEAISEDISKYGIALSGITEKIEIGKKLKLHLKLPGFNTSKDLQARMIWQIDNRCGLVFDLNDTEQDTISKSIDFFVSSHNIMDLVLSASAKRSIRKALKKKLPEYMVPATFVTMLEFPLTFSGKVDLKALPPPDEYGQILRKHFIAPQTEIQKKIAAIWSSLLDREHISMEDNFFELGGNSIKAAELSVKIMDEFNISIPANILFDLSYIPILAEYIESSGSHYSKQTLIQEDIERDRILPENIEPTGKVSPKVCNPDSILLTGAGGFLGIFLLNELLTTTNAKIYCLLRKGEFESAAVRLNATINKFKLNDNVSLSNRRIIAVPSDMGLDKFGIPEEQYRNMAEKVDLIYHCGAQVNVMASYNNLRGSNVQGTHEIIKFATTIQDKPIHYVSTLSSAYLTNEHNSLVEEFPSEEYYNLTGGYAISKWVSERLLTELKDRGSPVTIYRSGYISGDSTTGITSLNDSLLMLIKGCIDMGFAPDMKEKITILPVDFVSKSIIKLSLAASNRSYVYHIDHPTGIMWSDLVAWLNNYGYNIKMISMNEWKRKLRNIHKDNALYPFLPYYLALPDDYHSLEVSTEKAAAALSRVGLTFPPIDDHLLSIYFDYLCLEGFLTKPLKKKTTI